MFPRENPNLFVQYFCYKLGFLFILAYCCHIYIFHLFFNSFYFSSWFLYIWICSVFENIHDFSYIFIDSPCSFGLLRTLCHYSFLVFSLCNGSKLWKSCPAPSSLPFLSFSLFDYRYIPTLHKPRFQQSSITWELLLRYSLFPVLLLLCSVCVCVCFSLLFMLEHHVNLGKNY